MTTIAINARGLRRTRQAFSLLLSRVAQSLRERGPLVTAKAIVRRCRSILSPQFWEFRREDVAFDQHHGITTGLVVPLKNLRIDSPNRRFGRQYEGVPCSSLRRILNTIGIDHRRFTFVDLGSGLGRAVFVAAEFPFRRIIGVEFAPVLHSLAQQNLRHCRRGTLACTSIELLCMDAANCPIPMEPVLIYLFNPFSAEVMKKVVAHINDSVLGGHRDVIVVYLRPTHESVFAGSPCLEMVASGQGKFGYRVYRVALAAAVNGPDALEQQ